MKTSISLRQNSSYFYAIGLLSFLLASCGSYQNTSYHDNDGIYGGSTRTYAQTNTTNTNNQYKDYFKSLQDDNQPTEIFTDVDNYGNYSVNDSTQTASVAYPAWGSATTDVSVNVYSDPSWSLGFGFGFGYPYYGWGYGGWGYPGYWGPGWGYPGWGYPGYWGPGYGYNNYSYNYGRRGSAAYYGGRNYASNRNYVSNRNYSTGRNFNSNRNYTTNRDYSTNRGNYNTNRQNGFTDYRRSSNVNGRTYNPSSPNFTNRRSTTQGQNNSYDYSNRRSSSTTTTRSYDNSNSNRSYSPSPSRSYNNSGSGGGSMRSSSGSSGGGGGGRSYGGGGGGRR